MWPSLKRKLKTKKVGDIHNVKCDEKGQRLCDKKEVTVQNSVFTMVLDAGGVAKATRGHHRCVKKEKTQSGSLFEGCRDVVRASEHNQLTHLFKRLRDNCVNKKEQFPFFSIGEKIQGNE